MILLLQPLKTIFYPVSIVSFTKKPRITKFTNFVCWSVDIVSLPIVTRGHLTRDMKTQNKTKPVYSLTRKFAVIYGYLELVD